MDKAHFTCINFCFTLECSLSLLNLGQLQRNKDPLICFLHTKEAICADTIFRLYRDSSRSGEISTCELCCCDANYPLTLFVGIIVPAVLASLELAADGCALLYNQVVP